MQSMEQINQLLNSIRKERNAFIGPLAGLNIEEEYSLIHKKQSRLPSALRQLIIKRYESLKADKK